MALCEYADNSPNAESDMNVDLSDAPARALQQVNTTVNIDQTFEVGLSIVTYTRGAVSFYSRETYATTCAYNITEFVNNLWNVGEPADRHIKTEVFDTTEGLLIFSMIMQVFAWLTIAAVHNNATSSKYAVLAFRICQGLSLFFAFVTVVYFGASPAMQYFCNGINGGWGIGKGCGYGDGFGIACAALVVLAVNEALGCLWMTADVSDHDQAKPGSGSLIPDPLAVFSGSSSSAPGGQGGYAPVGVPAAPPEPVPVPTVGSYQSSL